MKCKNRVNSFIGLMILKNIVLKSHLVSVIVPIFNADKYLHETIQSVISQTYTNWEMILINDGSTDLTPNIIDQFTEMDYRIRQISLKTSSGGPAYPRNLGIKHAKGQYIAFLDADDVWDVNKLMLQVELINENKCDVVHCGASIFDSRGEIKGVLNSYNKYQKLRKLFGDKFTLMILNPIVLSSTLIKNSSSIKFREDSNLQSIEDWFLWIELSLSAAKIEEMNKNLVYYRRHESSLSELNGNTQRLRAFYAYATLLIENKLSLTKFIVLTSIRFSWIIYLKVAIKINNILKLK